MKWVNSDGTLSVSFDDGETFTVTGNRAAKATVCLMQGDIDGARELVDRTAQLAVFTESLGIEWMSEREAWLHGEQLDDELAARLAWEMDEGRSGKDLLAFVERLFENPSMRARQQFYSCLKHFDLEILPNGMVRGWKGLNSDMYSIHAGHLILLQGKTDATGRIYNGVGEVIECVRESVQDDPMITCSHGLHVGAFRYARSFGQRVVEVHFSPEDVVSIPADHDAEKLRVCKYTVVSEYKAPVEERDENESVLKSFVIKQIADLQALLLRLNQA
jgi:hypothetical protein